MSDADDTTVAGKRRVRRPATVMLILLVIAAVAAVAVAARVVFLSPDEQPSAAAAMSPTQTSPASPAPVATSRSLGVSPRLTIASLDIAAELHAYDAQEAAEGYDEVAETPCLVDGVIVCVDPASMTDVVWQQGGRDGVLYGAAPSARATQNVYLFGHADSTGTAVFSRLGELAAGDHVDVATSAGTLTYVVQDVVTVDKDDYTSLPQANEQVPGRMLLVSCDHREGAEQVNGGYARGNIVVVAQLDDASR